MIFYIKCTGCSRTLSRNLDKYYAKMKHILDDPDKTNKQKEMEAADL